jgi:hypothetical protein
MIAEGLFAKDGKLFVLVSITEWDKQGNLLLAPSLDRESDTLLPKNTVRWTPSFGQNFDRP